MTDGLEITAWAYDTPNPNGTWNGNLSWHKPSPIGTQHATPLYTRETLEKAVAKAVEDAFAAAGKPIGATE